VPITYTKSLKAGSRNRQTHRPEHYRSLL